MGILNKLRPEYRVDGFSFEFNESCESYDCRGEIMYDDEHDQIPEPALWEAAEKLAKQLQDEGAKAEASHSEKGWVEVQITR